MTRHSAKSSSDIMLHGRSFFAVPKRSRWTNMEGFSFFLLRLGIAMEAIVCRW